MPKGKSSRKVEEKPEGKRSRAKSRKAGRWFRWSEWSLRRRFGVGLVAVLLLAALGLKWKIDSDIQDAMEGPTWDVPALVFAEPVKLDPGLGWGADEVESLLVDLGYVRQRDARSPGSYEAREGSVLVHLRALELPDRRRDPLPVAVSFAGGAVS
ncbi:MAG: hypothetical protein HY900_10115, partial [Deltaproteobacteria bacterium]|nr:hypothetical protein [Deltaproteobacteria bacterium]